MKTINEIAGGCGHNRCQNFSCIMQEARSLLAELESIVNPYGLTIETETTQAGIKVTLLGGELPSFGVQWLWPITREVFKADWRDTFRSYAVNFGASCYCPVKDMDNTPYTGHCVLCEPNRHV